jgi:hypothetical protein
MEDCWEERTRWESVNERMEEEIKAESVVPQGTDVDACHRKNLEARPHDPAASNGHAQGGRGRRDRPGEGKHFPKVNVFPSVIYSS